MANVEIADLDQITDNQSGDLIAVQRGSGAGSGKYQEKDDFLTNWPFAVTLESTLNVDSTLTVGDWTGGSAPSANANNFEIRVNGTGGMTISTPATASGNIYFSDPGSSTVGRIQYNHTNNTMSFWRNNTQTADLDQNLDLLVGGLQFAGGDVLSNFVDATAFTPDLNFGGSEISTDAGGYTRRTGYYMRIGPLVAIFVRLELSAKGNHTGAATITGFPVNESGTGNVNGGMFFSRLDDLAYSGEPHAYIQTGTISLYESTSGNSRTTITDADFENATDIELWGLYFAA